MRILVACEESQAVCKEFRLKGHEAYSCDILPCSGGHPEWHIQADLADVISQRTWDMIIAFPPCTYLCSSGMHWTTRGLRDPQLTADAITFVKMIWNADCSRIAIENPIGALSKAIRKSNQIIQPWFFGDDASKSTCLWLKGLPELEPTNIIPPKGFQPVVYAGDLPVCECCEEPFCNLHEDHFADCSCYGPTQDDLRYVKISGFEFACPESFTGKPVWANQTPSGQNKLGPSADRATLRSKTYPGIARFMAERWG